MSPRSPARIPVVLNALYEAWQRQPDWRLGQLLANAAPGRDPFVIEEEEWARLLAEVPAAEPTTPSPQPSRSSGLSTEAAAALRPLAVPFDVEGLAAVLDRLRGWDPYAAATWLSTPSPALGGSRPVECAGRDAEAVLEALDALEAGGSAVQSG